MTYFRLHVAFWVSLCGIRLQKGLIPGHEDNWPLYMSSQRSSQGVRGQVFLVELSPWTQLHIYPLYTACQAAFSRGPPNFPLRHRQKKRKRFSLRVKGGGWLETEAGWGWCSQWCFLTGIFECWLNAWVVFFMRIYFYIKRADRCEFKHLFRCVSLEFFPPWCPFAHTLTTSELSYPGAEERQIYRRFQVCKADLRLLLLSAPPLREQRS